MTWHTQSALRILCWQGYETEAVLQPFASRHGIDTYAETLLSDATTAQRLSAGEAAQWDVLNINNAYVRDDLYPRGLIRELNPTRFEPYWEHLLPQFQRLYRWMYAEHGALIGICQRFGAFNLVVNTDRIDRRSAEDQGFALVNEAGYRRRFGILRYDDFNIFHLCIGAGLNPFLVMQEQDLERFAAMARQWWQHARLITDDHRLLNQALIDGDIDFYLSGGVYTVSPARLAGYSRLRAVTPNQGPIAGRGGIAFTEITSCLKHPGLSPVAEDFLEYLLQPEVAVQAAFVQGTCNPVAQMGNPEVFKKFSKAQLAAIQWDSLEEDIARCADYQIPPSYNVLLQRLNAVIAGN